LIVQNKPKSVSIYQKVFKKKKLNWRKRSCNSNNWWTWNGWRSRGKQLEFRKWIRCRTRTRRTCWKNSNYWWRTGNV